MLHANDSHFKNEANYKTFRLLDKSQASNGSMPAPTDTCTKRFDTPVKSYKSDDKNPIIVLCFLPQFKRVCDSDRVFAGMALTVVPTFMKDGPVSSQTIPVNPYGDKEVLN